MLLRSVWIGVVVGCGLTAGCPATGRDTDGGGRDGGAVDAAPRDGGRVDGGPRRDGGRLDAGPRPDGGGGGIVIDGVVSDAEWAGAMMVANSVATDWGVGLNALSRLRAVVRDGSLFVAVEGRVESSSGNAILLYVDNDLPGTAGVADLFSLVDSTGALDDALSAGLSTPSGFDADLAWGTRAMGRAAAGFDEDMGWRDVAADVGNFSWVDSAEAPTSCGADACETRIPLSALGGPSSGTLAMFARIGNADGTAFSNQCLPEDMSAMPQSVSVLLEVAH